MPFHFQSFSSFRYPFFFHEDLVRAGHKKIYWEWLSDIFQERKLVRLEESSVQCPWNVMKWRGSFSFYAGAFVS